MDGKVAKMVENAYAHYNGSENLDVKDYELVAKSPNGLIYDRPSSKIRVYAFRGTQNKEDVRSFPSLISNTFASSSRYKKDKAFVQKHPAPAGYRTVAGGHSLGGAIVDQLLADGLVQSGISFNPAVELSKLHNAGNKRIYNRHDFLYKLIGMYASNVHTTNNTMWDKISATVSFLNILKSLYEHNHKQFVESKKKEEPRSEAHPTTPHQSSYIIQTVVLHKAKFPSLELAKEWAVQHKYKIHNVDETHNEYRFRQVSPELIKTGHYHERMVPIGDVGYLGVLYK
jgi:hypothetical protein